MTKDLISVYHTSWLVCITILTFQGIARVAEKKPLLGSLTHVLAQFGLLPNEAAAMLIDWFVS